MTLECNFSMESNGDSVNRDHGNDIIKESFSSGMETVSTEISLRGIRIG